MIVYRGRGKVNVCEKCYKDIFTKFSHAKYCKECAIIVCKERARLMSHNKWIKKVAEREKAEV